MKRDKLVQYTVFFLLAGLLAQELEAGRGLFGSKQASTKQDAALGSTKRTSKRSRKKLKPDIAVAEHAALGDFTEHKIVLQIQEPDGTVLTRNGELIIRPQAKATVLLAHGFKHDKRHSKALRVLFPHYNTIIFDFRAHGDKAHGQTCSFGAQEVREVKAAADFVTSHPSLKNLPLFGYGVSMGAVALIEAQSQFNLFEGIILDSPFESMEYVVKRGLTKITYSLFGWDVLKPIRYLLERVMFSPYADWVLRFLLRNAAGMDTHTTATSLRPVEPIKSIKSITIPTLVIGCNQDHVTPPEIVARVYKEALHRSLSELWLVDGKGHVDAFFSHPEQYIKKVNEFITNVLQTL